MKIVLYYFKTKYKVILKVIEIKQVVNLFIFSGEIYLFYISLILLSFYFQLKIR